VTACRYICKSTTDALFYIICCDLLLFRVEFTTPNKFFSELEETEASKLCCWSGELYLELHNGTYTTQAQVKPYLTLADFSAAGQVATPAQR